METSQGLEIHQLLALARTLLVRARIAKQHAVIVIETPSDIHSDAEVRRVHHSYRQDAYVFRKEAREILRLVEKKNGSRYLAGLPIFPLSICLSGSVFRNWPEYKSEYEFETLYHGTDPC